MDLTLEKLTEIAKQIKKLNTTVPKGKMLMISDKEVYDQLINDGWTGNITYSRFLPDNQAVLFDEDVMKLKYKLM